MDYTLIDAGVPGEPNPQSAELRRFDSAYRAMEVLREALVRGEPGAKGWRVLDGAGRVLIRPDDLDLRAR